jgi:hypothetical protein
MGSEVAPVARVACSSQGSSRPSPTIARAEEHDGVCHRRGSNEADLVLDDEHYVGSEIKHRGFVDSQAKLGDVVEVPAGEHGLCHREHELSCRQPPTASRRRTDASIDGGRHLEDPVDLGDEAEPCSRREVRVG